MDEKTLIKLGFNIKEAKVYIACIELGPSFVTDIASRSAINRTTTYHILEQLCIYGLISKTSGHASKKKYSPEHPINLLYFFENKQKTASKNTEKVKLLLPFLSDIYKSKNKPIMKFYEGTDGIKKIYSETLKSKTEILAIGDIDEWEDKNLKNWVKQYAKKRTSNKIYERGLITSTEKGINWVTKYPATTKYNNFRYLPKEKFPYLGSEVDIFEDKVVIVLLKKPNRLGVLIQSKELSTVMKTLFELAWEAAEKYNKK
ncbi:MAG: helix-turn-helix domain-containing protein [Patescibacteria group bacterium]